MRRDYNFHMEREAPQKLDARPVWLLIAAYALSFVVLSFFFQSPMDMIRGYGRILTSPSLLTTDYMALGGCGAALWNAALVLLLLSFYIFIVKIEVSGKSLAGLVFVTGFAFFGTNPINTLPILCGGFLSAKAHGQTASTTVLATFFATCLGPVVSFTLFASDWPLLLALPTGILEGVLIGFLVPQLSESCLNFHGGYTLYNVGFTAGILGLLAAAVMNYFGFFPEPVRMDLSQGYPGIFAFLQLSFVALILSGLMLDSHNGLHYRELLRHSGHQAPDFTRLHGLGLSFVNMGLLGLMASAAVLVGGVPLNGPVLGSILAVMAFAAIGKHPRNSIPVMLGVGLAVILNPDELSPTGRGLALLFSTALAPLAGEFGLCGGVFVGFIFAMLVNNALNAHVGLNLYNGGFTSGFVAFLSLPVLRFARSLRRRFKASRGLPVRKPADGEKQKEDGTRGEHES